MLTTTDGARLANFEALTAPGTFGLIDQITAFAVSRNRAHRTGLETHAALHAFFAQDHEPDQLFALTGRAFFLVHMRVILRAIIMQG